MQDKPRILEFLRAADDPAADQSLAAALPHVDPLLQLELIDTLLHRDRPEGLAFLPEIFDQLTEAGRSHVVAGSAKLFSSLRNSIRSPNSQTRINALDIVRRGGNPRLAYLAAVAIHDGAAKIRADAAETLRQMAEKHLVNHAQTTSILRDGFDAAESMNETIVATIQMVSEERKYLLAALREALGSFESHHRPEILEASMLFADELVDVLFKGGTLLRGKLTHAMIEIVGDKLRPHVVPFVYVALGHSEMRRKMVALLANCHDSEFFVEFIRHHWLGLDPAIRKNLGAIRSLEWLGDGFEAAFTIPPEVAAMVPSWLMELGLAVDQKVAVLSNLLLVDNVSANRAAIWALTRFNMPAATSALQGALEHEDEGIRALARREVEFRRRRALKTSQHVRQDRPAEWARLLNSAGLTETFEDFWQNFECIGPELAMAEGRGALEFVPGLSIHLRTRLMDQQPAERIRALRFVSTLGLAKSFAAEIFGLCNDALAEVRAMAMQTLGHIGDTTSRRILERAVSHDTPTVQARAIESLDQIGEIRDPAILIPLLNCDDAHVRGAAIRVLLRLHSPEAASTLVGMLRDRRVEHRCTALWVIDQLRLISLASRLEEMAQGDPDPRIGRTARQVLRRLQPFRSAGAVEASTNGGEILNA